MRGGMASPSPQIRSGAWSREGLWGNSREEQALRMGLANASASQPGNAGHGPASSSSFSGNEDPLAMISAVTSRFRHTESSAPAQVRGPRRRIRCCRCRVDGVANAPASGEVRTDGPRPCVRERRERLGHRALTGFRRTSRPRALLSHGNSDYILIGATHTHSAPDAYAFPDGKGGTTADLKADTVVIRAPER